MSPVYHTLYSGFFSTAYAFVTHSFWGTIVCFLSGILMDLDHLVDYILTKKRITLSYKALLSFFGSEKRGKIYILFHSYELIIVLWIIVAVYKLNDVWIGFAVGVTTHLLLDRFYNPVRPFVYFFMYRLKNNFVKECIYPQNYFKKMT